MKKKLIAIILAVSLGVVLGGYLLLGQPKPNITDSPDTSGATPSPATSTPNETPIESQKTTSEAELNQTIPTPTVPEFTITLTNHSSDTPTTYSTDPYTGENITHPGVHSEWQTLDFTIKNQPFFTPTKDNYGMFTGFNIRYKGHFAQNWITLFTAPEYPDQNSTSEYTIVSFALEGRGIPYTWLMTLEFPANAQVEFQVEALRGHTYRDQTQTLCPWAFDGKESGWSETQTLTIP